MNKAFSIDTIRPILDAYNNNEITNEELVEVLNKISESNHNLNWYVGAPTGIASRDGEMICGGDTVETVQGTVFEVGYDHVFKQFVLIESEIHYELKPFMTPNLWIKERVERK